MTVKRKSTNTLWHKRLGHLSKRNLLYLSGVCGFTCSTDIECCDMCHRAKQTQIPFPLSDNKASRAFELVHCDLLGRYHTPSLSGAYYFLTIVDDFTRSTWVYLLHDKSKTQKVLYPLVLWLGDNLVLIKVVRSDNGTKFLDVLMNFFLVRELFIKPHVLEHHNKVEEWKESTNTYSMWLEHYVSRLVYP